MNKLISMVSVGLLLGSSASNVALAAEQADQTASSVVVQNTADLKSISASQTSATKAKQETSTNSTQIKLVPTANVSSKAAGDFSMSNIFGSGANDQYKGDVVVAPNPHYDAGEPTDFMNYGNTAASLQNALYDLYQNGQSSTDYVLYVGSSINAASLTALTARTSVATSASDVSFYSLGNKIRKLTLTGSAVDPVVGTETSSNTSYSLLTLPTSVDFGTDIEIRNLRYRATNMYANGHALTLGTGSYGTVASNVYGGANNVDVTGNPTLNIQSTGADTWNVYGGNQNGGTVNGNITTTISDASGTIGEIGGAGKNGNVVGNVNTTINIANAATAFRLGDYFGGTSSTTVSNITGSVNNKITGYGRWTNNAAEYYGGSNNGNITATTGSAITSDVDTSAFSAGSTRIAGANRTEGTITGNISSTLKAGKDNKGSFNVVDGGNSSYSASPTLASESDTAYDALTNEQRSAEAEQKATFKVYGDITTNILEGSASMTVGDPGYTRGAGYHGYIEGNVTTNVGTLNNGQTGGAGFVYDAGDYTDSLPYSNSINNRGYVTDYDIFGGGGTGAKDMYIKGNTKVNQNNVRARWTYGAGFTGILEGDSTITLNGGLVDTLEGSGYQMYRHFGNSNSIANDGQIDWFFTGGSWSDQKEYGNSYTEANGGTINATFGGLYGDTDDTTIIGNSSVMVRGGDFSGPCRSGVKALTAGPANDGYILGNLELTMDLRTDKAATFKLPKGTSISAGKPDSSRASTVKVGEDENSTLTLNIFTKPGTDVLNGATILGDSTPNTNTTAGSIDININAPDSTLGKILATEDSNISSGKILRDVNINVQNAKSIGGLSGGSATDDFNDTVVGNSTKKVQVNLGKVVDDTNSTIQDQSINFTGLGLVDFTSLNLQNGVTMEASTGSVKNGVGATAANHAATHSTFGDITLSDGSGIAVTDKSALISAGVMKTEGNSTVTSYAGSGIINISAYQAAANKSMQWRKLGSGEPLVSGLNGTWFGKQDGYQVITVNPDATNSSQITPENFNGIEVATGKTFLGDNTQDGTNGYGIAIPGAIIDYHVLNNVAGGLGTIHHNVTAVKPNNKPLTINAWGTEVANTEVTDGKLMIPASAAQKPELTFTPDQASGSWFHYGTVHSSQVGSKDETMAESSTSNPKKWDAQSLNYSYTVNVGYSNLAELTAQNRIITESQAAKIGGGDEVSDLLAAKGRPFFKSDYDANMLALINKPLADDEYSRKIPVTFTVGSGDNSKTMTVNLVIVKDGAEIPVGDDTKFAIYAEDTFLKLKEANALADKTALNQYTKAQVIFADNRPNVEPNLDDATFNQIKGTTPDNVPNLVPTTYTYTDDGLSGSLKVNVKVGGILELVEAPKTLDFGVNKVTNKTLQKFAQTSDSLTISDTRGADSDSWSLLLSEQSPLTDGTHTLTGCVSYQNGTQNFALSNAAQVVEGGQGLDGKKVISDDWNNTDHGVKLTVPVEKQLLGNYTGVLSWQLADVPANN